MYYILSNMRLRKKALSLLLLFWLINIIFFMPSVESRNYILKTQSTVTIISDETDFGILIPDSSEVYTNLTVIYEYGRLARPEGFPFPRIKMPTIINLTIESMPEWCSVQLNQQRFEAEINTFFLPKTRTINFTTQIIAKIDSVSAPAFEEGIIKLNVTAEENGNIQSSSSSIEISITPDFIPSINVYTTNSSVDLMPGEQTTALIMVKNNGNAKIVASIENTTSSDNIEITLPNEKTIEVNEEVSFSIPIKALESDEKINISEDLMFIVTYYAYSDSTLLGEDIQFYILANIESKNNDLISFDLIIILLIIAVISIIFIIIFYLYYRRKSSL